MADRRLVLLQLCRTRPLSTHLQAIVAQRQLALDAVGSDDGGAGAAALAATAARPAGVVE